MQAEEILRINKIIPVISVEKAEWAVDLAKALLEGGVRILEITLRTKGALKAIELIKTHCPEAVVGAGTVINAWQIKQAQDSGAEFIISPGLNAVFLKECKDSLKVPLIPGVSSAGEVMLALEYGLSYLKLFPAEAVGGVPLLKAFEGPFSQVKFCPTGGISVNNANSYLELKNVLCVGSSWLSPKELVEEKKWDEITKLAKLSQNF